MILTTSRLGIINIFYTKYLDNYEFGILLLSAYFGDMLYAGGGINLDLLTTTFHFSKFKY